MAERTVMMRFPKETDAAGNALVRPVRTSRVDYARKTYGAIIDDRSLSGAQRSAKFVADILPSAGGIAGDILGKIAGTAGTAAGTVATGGAGVVGAPVIIGGASVLGSGIGSGAGQAGREGLYRLIGLGDAPGTIGEEAAWGAGGALTGHGLGALAKGGGRVLMSTALGQNAAKNAELVSNLLKERIPVGKLIPKSVTSLGKTGSDVAEKLYERALKLRNIALDKAGIAGATVERKSASDAVAAIAAKAMKEEDEKVAAALTKRLGSFTHKTVKVNGRTLVIPKPATFAPEEAQKIVTRYDKVLEAYYTKVSQGKPVPFDALPPKLQYAKTIADNMREQLRNVVPKLGMVGKKGARVMLDYKTINQQLGSAIGMKNAINLAESMDWTRRLTASALGGAGLGMATAGIGQLASGVGGSDVGKAAATGAVLGAFPSLSSRAALGLTNPATQSLLRYVVPQAGLNVIDPNRRMGQ